MNGRTLYDWWSQHGELFDRLYDIAFLGREREFRERSVELLSLAEGGCVLELGCGPGNSFEKLRARVGSSGRVVGVDYSAGMAKRAGEEIRKSGWQNVHALCGDSSRPAISDGSFDAVYASMTLSAMANPRRAIDAAYRVVHPGGRLVVLDAQPFQTVPLTLLNPAIIPVAKRATDWAPETDLPDALTERFESVSVETFFGGVIFIAVARRAE